MELDSLDQIAADAFDGYIVRKDLVRKFARQYPVPTYVCEFLLGRYCCQHQRGGDPGGLADRRAAAARPGRSAAARKNSSSPGPARPGSVKIIDLISARLDAKTDSYLATLPSLQLKDVCIENKLVNDNERMLTGGFYAEIDLDVRRRRSPRRRTAGPFSVPACGRSSSRSGTCWNALYEGRAQVHDRRSGSTSCCAALAWSRRT